MTLKSVFFLLIVPLMWVVASGARDLRDHDEDKDKVPFLEVQLSKLGYQPTHEYHYPGTGIPRNLSILYDDDNKRLAFINNKVLVVYFSHLPPPGDDNSRNMEALFVATNSGSLISRKTWVTRKRRWFNERWDTEARILPARDGFLVHAGGSLVLYGADQQEKAKLSLDSDFRWAASVAPLGRRIHLQQIRGADSAEGQWLEADTLTKLETQHEVAGIMSASDHAVVTYRAHCLQLQAIGAPLSSLCCDRPCQQGTAQFLSENEIISVYGKGFTVLSASGEKLWNKQAIDASTSVIDGYSRSLDGARFAVLLWSDRKIVFDEVNVPKGQPMVLVYERSTRTRVFTLPVGSVSERFTFGLSPDGSILAVLMGDLVRLYKIQA